MYIENTFISLINYLILCIIYTVARFIEKSQLENVKFVKKETEIATRALFYSSSLANLL